MSTNLPESEMNVDTRERIKKYLLANSEKLESQIDTVFLDFKSQGLKVLFKKIQDIFGGGDEPGRLLL